VFFFSGMSNHEEAPVFAGPTDVPDRLGSFLRIAVEEDV
jgi:hypothetical protein